MINYFDELLRKLWKCYETETDVTISIRDRHSFSFTSFTFIPEIVKYDGNIYIESGNNNININCTKENIDKVDEDYYIITTDSNNYAFQF